MALPVTIAPGVALDGEPITRGGIKSAVRLLTRAAKGEREPLRQSVRPAELARLLHSADRFDLRGTSRCRRRRCGRTLDWLVSFLVEAAAPLGLIPPVDDAAETLWTRENLGMGEQRHVQTRAWTSGGVTVWAEVAEHEIYDCATPMWTVLRGVVTGFPDGAELSVAATVRCRTSPSPP